MGLQEKASKAFYNALRIGKTSVANSHKEDAERPMIGGMKCINCRNFKGRCRKTREVLCGFRYKK